MLTALMRTITSLIVFASLHAFAAPIDPANVDRLFADYARPGAPGASVLVLKDGAVVLQKAYGLADVEGRSPAAVVTNYRLASVTKQFTAMAIMILADRGQLNLDATVLSLLPDFPTYARNITIRQLLNHLGGLMDYEDHLPSGQTQQLTDGDVLTILRGLNATYFTPGSQYKYSNSGYVVLGLVVAAVSGQTFPEFLQDNIFTPLEMSGTVAYVRGVNQVEHRAYGYSAGGSGWTRTDQSLTSATLGDGGVYTSIVDYAKWDAALYGDRLVSSAMLALAFTPGRLANGTATGYGFGWTLDTYRGLKRVAHTGSTVGFRTAVERFPERKITVVVLINRADSTPSALARSVTDMVLSGE